MNPFKSNVLEIVYQNVRGLRSKLRELEHSLLALLYEGTLLLKGCVTLKQILIY